MSWRRRNPFAPKRSAIVRRSRRMPAATINMRIGVRAALNCIRNASRSGISVQSSISTWMPRYSFANFVSPKTSSPGAFSIASSTRALYWRLVPPVRPWSTP